MPTAILSALAEEQAGLIERLHDPVCHRHAGREFWCGQLHGQSVVLALSRVGKVAAATTATALIERFAVRRIVFTGVAGGLGQGVQVGDIVVASSFVQHDMDASPLFKRYEVPLYGKSHFGADVMLSQALLAAARQVVTEPRFVHGVPMLRSLGVHAPQVHSGLVISGDRFVATSEESRALRERLPDALAVEMEGAAVAQVCHDFAVPFAAVRTISDRADDSAHVDFGAFVKEVASAYSRDIIEGYLSQPRL